MSSISASNLDWICCKQFTNTSNRYLVSGTFLTGGEWQPTLGSHDNTLSTWQPLWICPGQTTIFGQVTSAIAAINGNKVYVVGNTETTGVLRCNSFFVNNTPIYRTLSSTFTEQTISTVSSVYLGSVVFPNGFKAVNRMRIAVKTSGVSVNVVYSVIAYDGAITNGGQITSMQVTEVNNNTGKMLETITIGTPNPINGTSALQLNWISGTGSVTIMAVTFEYT